MTIKLYTDLKQSEKLMEFLPLESADGFHAANVIITEPFITYLNGERNIPGYKGAIPCWSLAALLDVLPYPEIWQDHSTNRWACSSLIKDTEYLWESENPVDSCVEVIIKLHKEGLL